MDKLNKFVQLLEKANIKSTIKCIKHWEKDKPPLQKVHGRFINQRKNINFFYYDNKLSVCFGRYHRNKKYSNREVFTFSAKRGNLQLFVNNMNLTTKSYIFLNTFTEFCETIVTSNKKTKSTKAVTSKKSIWKMYKLIKVFCELEGLPIDKMKKKDTNLLNFKNTLVTAFYPGIKYIAVSDKNGLHVPRYLTEDLNKQNVTKEQIYRKLFRKHKSPILEKAIFETGLNSSMYDFIRLFGYRYNKEELEKIVSLKQVMSYYSYYVRPEFFRKLFSNYGKIELLQYYLSNNIAPLVSQWSTYKDKIVLPKNINDLDVQVHNQHEVLRKAHITKAYILIENIMKICGDAYVHKNSHYKAKNHIEIKTIDVEKIKDEIVKAKLINKKLYMPMNVAMEFTKNE